MAPPVDTPSAGDRIAKLLARAGVASRREIERMIADGRVARDGVAVDTPATVLRSLHGVTVDGNPVAAPAPARLFLHHKPPGLLVTERDPAGRPTIYDRLPSDLPRVVPVGRLDLNTEGLLLLTTDGGLKRQLELPATGVERAYRARAYGPITQARLEELIEGVEIEGVRYGAIDANLERRTGANSWIELILTEGKNREVRRVLEYLGLEVSRLIRTRYGPFVLGDLPPGAIGEVRQVDLVAFRQALAGKRPAGPERVSVQAALPRPVPTATQQSDGDGAATPLAGGVARARSGPRAERSPSSAVRSRRPAEPIADAPTAERARRRATHPGVGRGPTAPQAKEREIAATGGARPGRNSGVFRQAASDNRGQRSPQTAPQLGSGLRRGGATPDGSRQGDAPARATSDHEPTPRPAKPPQRKSGWAKPKPKSGPRRPGKPR